MAKPPSGAGLIDAIEAITGHRFADEGLLRRALTHASAGDSGEDYQRLEFLGDRVLGLIVAQMVFEANPRAPEGELSLRFNALVKAETLAEIGDEIGLSSVIVAGSQLRTLQGRKRVNLRADVVEALIAAVYLDGGLEVARAFVERHWRDRSRAETAARRDPKTELQEWAHQAARAAPVYSIDKREGPDHDPVFEVSVRVGSVASAVGRGRSKREAEQAAAMTLLVREGVWKGESA